MRLSNNDIPSFLYRAIDGWTSSGILFSGRQHDPPIFIQFSIDYEL